MNFRKILALALVLIMALGVFAACGQPSNPDDSKEYTGEMADNGNTYADPNWLPVVKNPIQVEGIVHDPKMPGAPFELRSIFNEIAETTGVHITMQLAATQEICTLMFASRNYPDFSFRIFVDDMQNQACYEGDILQLTDEILEKYAPNYYQLFVENPDIYKMCLLPDGNLYFFPQWVMEEHSYQLRDGFWINETWLDELGLDLPTTTDEYLNYLRAVKAQAGQGSIPENAAPLFVRGGLENIGGAYSILDWFGVFNGFEYEIVDNGVVKHNAQNPNIKQGMKFLGQLYSEGLINNNAFTVTWAEYQVVIGDDHAGDETPWTGSFFAFDLGESLKEDYCAVQPLQTGTGLPVYVRSFGADNRIIDNALSIFTSSENQIALIRAFDHYATGEGAMRAVIGEQGEDKQWYKKDDGTYAYAEDAWGTDNPERFGWNDYGPGVVTPDITDQLNAESMEDHDSRAYVYEHIYKQYIPKDKTLYPTDAINYLTPDEAAQAELIRTQCRNVVNTFYRKWFQAKTNVDDEWDMFQMALKNSGIETRLALLQKAYDAYMANSIG